MLYRSAILLILCHLGHGGGAVAVAGPSPGVGGGNSLGSALWPRLVVRGGGGGDASIEKAKRVAAEKSAKFKEWIESRKTAARAEAAAAGIQVDGITATATATATPTSTACASGMESKSSGSSAATDSGTTTFKLYRVSPHPATGAVMLSHVHASSRGRLRQDDWCMGVSEADDLGYIAVSVIPGAGGGDIVPAAELAAEQELERGGGGATGTKAMGPNKGLFAKVLVMKECLVEAGGVDCVCTVSGRWRIKGRLALQREEASGPAGGGKRVAFASSPPRIDSRVPQAQASAPATPVPGGARAKHPASRQQAEQRPAHSETQQGSSSGEKTRVDTTAASPTVVSVSKLQDADPAPLPKLSSLSPSFEENEGGVSAGASAICMDPGAVSVVTLRDFRVGAEERDETPSPLRRARTSSRYLALLILILIHIPALS